MVADLRWLGEWATFSSLLSSAAGLVAFSCGSKTLPILWHVLLTWPCFCTCNCRGREMTATSYVVAFLHCEDPEHMLGTLWRTIGT